MRHESRHFGPFTYRPDEVLTFPYGIMGYDGYTRYVLMDRPDTSPLRWLLSVEPGGPELALVDPAIFEPEYGTHLLEEKPSLLRRLGAASLEGVDLYAVVTLPENILHMSMDLRAPILVNQAAMRGAQYSAGVRNQATRVRIYQDFVGSGPADLDGTLIMLRKEGQTVDIGNDITVQVLDFVNGGVRLGITAPRKVSIRRGRGTVTPSSENRRASEEMDIERMRAVVGLRRAGMATEEEVAAVHAEPDMEDAAAS